MSATDIAGAQRSPLKIAKLIEHEQRVVAGEAEMAVVGCTLLLAMGRADRAIHIQHDQLRRLSLMNPVDPDTREIGQGDKVVIRGQQFCLELAHLAGRCAATLDGLAADDPAHRGIAPEPVGIVDILVSCQSAIDRLSQEADQTVPVVLARSHVSDKVTGQCSQAKGVIEFPIGEQTGVGSDPRPMKLKLQAAIKSRP